MPEKTSSPSPLNTATRSYQAIFDLLGPFDAPGLRDGPEEGRDPRAGSHRFLAWLVERYWSAAYREPNSAPWDVPAAQPAFVALVETGQLAPGRTAIDLGCGSGENALFLAAAGLRVTGVDLSATAIAQARRKSAARGIEVDLRVGDALHDPIVHPPFDHVIDSCLFHTFGDRDQAIYVARIRALLRDQGTLFLLCCSDAERPWERARAMGTGPRRIRRADIEARFRDGFAIDSLCDSTIATTTGAMTAHIACIRKNARPTRRRP